MSRLTTNGVLNNRFVFAATVAALIYGCGVGVGGLLYATGAIATGATHNDCENYAEVLAPQYGGDEESVPQSAIKAEAETCLAGHELTPQEAFRTEYLFGSLWPAIVCALIIIAWPAWARALHNQEQADLAGAASRLEMGL